MLVLFIYLLWSISYLIVLMVFKLFFFKNFLNKKSKFFNFLLILYYNKNLSFYKNEVSELNYQSISYTRQTKYSILNIIHNKIDLASNNKNNFKNNFKINYNLYKHLSNNNLSVYTISQLNLVDYVILQNIIKSTTNNKFNNFVLVYYSIFKNSLTTNPILVDILYLNKLNNLNNFTGNLINKNKIKYKLFNKKLINISKHLTNLINISINGVTINSNFFKQLTANFNIKFSASNIVKYLSDLSVSKSTILFLRKNKIFNKSRYSRNRQTYRTGAYWCLYVNIIAVVAFYFWFYNFTMNFGYVWWLLYAFILSFFLFKAIKFNFYNINTLKNEVILSIKWFYIILNSFLLQILNLIKLLFKTQKTMYLIDKILYNNNSLIKKILQLLFKLNDYIYKI